MLVEEPRVARLLKGMVRRMTVDVVLREDLYQEALIRLWTEEKRNPTQTLSWYIQNCHYHLQNSLKRGRSVDSPKRRSQSTEWAAPEPAPDEYAMTGNEFPEPGSDGVQADMFSDVCAHDAVSELQDHLSLHQCQILGFFLDGSGVREVARELGVSHVSVLKHRQRIACIAARLGIGGIDAPTLNSTAAD